MNGDPLFLETAFAAGARLCRDALWHEHSCTWAGLATTDLGGGEWGVAPRAWGPDLYAGTAGNALFLARLFRATGEKLFRVTAEAAARHALAFAATIAPGGRAGFYAGQAGIAHACLELADCLNDDRWSAAGLDLLHSLDHELAAADLQLDLIGGVAGLLAVAVWAERRFPDAGLRALAGRCGELLVARARPSRGGLCWPPGLLGFSHGASGIGWALLELWQAQGGESFRAAALAAFRYERSFFDAARDNWPDLRGPSPSFPFHWCHGAPGIGFARLRAWEILGDGQLRSEAEAALRGTWRDFVGPRPGADNFSLCHGLAGNAELLLYAAQVLGDRRWREAAEQVGRTGIDDFRRRGEVWSSGLRTGEETPSLLPGSAGTGYFFLRLHDPERAPPILILAGR